MPIAPCTNSSPTASEIADALVQVVQASAFIDFRYEAQLPASKSPSALAAKSDTVCVGAPDHVKAWLSRTGGGGVVACKNGNIILRCRSINRRSAGKGIVSAPKGEYLWRAYRVQGVKLHTVTVLSGGKRFRLFPNALPL
jgi:hypothetical protein